MTHALKTWTEYFQAIVAEKKTFEIRKFDRPFKVDDILLLQEWDNEKQEYTRNEMRVTVTYLMSNVYSEEPVFGLAKGYCIMGIKEIQY